MNKNNHRYEAPDYISKIQTNLKEMKDQVSEYLKKHTIDKVPPILRARHYLLIHAINDIGSTSQSLKPKKIVKDLSSEKLGHVAEGDRFEPLRECEDEKQEKSKTAKQGRALLAKKQNKNGVQAGLNCLLPNICNLKLEFDDQNLSILNTKAQYFDQKRNKIMSEDSVQVQPQQTNKRYQSIDLKHRSFFKKTSRQHAKDAIKDFSKDQFLQKSKSAVRNFKNKSQEKKYNLDGFTQPGKLSQSSKIVNDKTIQQALKSSNQFQEIRELSFSSNNSGLNQIMRNSKQLNQHSHTVQRRKIQAKVNKQLEKSAVYKLSKKSIEKKPKISLSFVEYGKFGSRQISNKSQVFQPWQGQLWQKDKNEFLLQNIIY